MFSLALWRRLIGTRAQARDLRRVLADLPSYWDIKDEQGNVVGRERACPLIALLGREQTEHLYADRHWRQVIDSWDTGEVNKLDLIRLCRAIESGR